MSTSENRRNVTISKNTGGFGWRPWHDYLVLPVTDLGTTEALRCLDVAGKPAVRSYEYFFRVTN